MAGMNTRLSMGVGLQNNRSRPGKNITQLSWLLAARVADHLMDEHTIKQWHCQTHHGRRGRGFHYSDTAIETALMLKGVFKLPLRALEGFINSLFKLMQVPLTSPDYSSISRRANTVEVSTGCPAMAVAHLVIDATGLKVYGEGEWKVRKHGKEKRRVWRKLHLAVDAATHAIIAAEVSPRDGGRQRSVPSLLNPLRRKIEQVSADGADDTKACHALLKKKGPRPLSHRERMRHCGKRASAQ